MGKLDCHEVFTKAVPQAGSGLIGWYAIQVMKRPLQNGAAGMVGEIGEVVEDSGGDLLVRVRNELWHAVSRGAPLREGDQVEVVAVDRVTLQVLKPTPGAESLE